MIRLFFDGGCRPNPGPMEAAEVVRGRVHLFDDLGQGTGNQAEWRALVAAARIARDLGASEAEFVGDSLLVVRQVNGDWRCRDPLLAVHLEAFRRLAVDFSRVRVRHVLRARNLAGIALDRRRAGF